MINFLELLKYRYEKYDNIPIVSSSVVKHALMKMNQAIAGYHILMILSMVDDAFSPREDKLIADYLQENFPFRIDLDREIAILSELEKDQYMIHFQKAMDDFYEDSTTEERNHLMEMAKEAKSDQKVQKYLEKEVTKLIKELKLK